MRSGIGTHTMNLFIALKFVSVELSILNNVVFQFQNFNKGISVEFEKRELFNLLKFTLSTWNVF